MVPWSMPMVPSLDPMVHWLPEVLVPPSTSTEMVPLSMPTVPSSDPMAPSFPQVPTEVLPTTLMEPVHSTVLDSAGIPSMELH